jgi:hypothetical protein
MKDEDQLLTKIIGYNYKMAFISTIIVSVEHKKLEMAGSIYQRASYPFFYGLLSFVLCLIC